MEHLPKISVVVPVYNVEPYLDKCLDSIMKQTFSEFEVLCRDDASTDGSYHILEEYARRDPRFRISRNPCNIGAGKTRNIGLQEATADYVMFLDSDDWYDKDYFRKMYEKIEETGADIVICRYAKYNEKNGEIDPVPDMDSANYSAIKDGFSVRTIPEQIFTLFRILPQIKIYRKRFILDEGLYFQDLPNQNDAYFGILSLAYAKRIYYLPLVLVYYRYERMGSITTTGRNEISCTHKVLLECYRALSCRKELWEICRKSFFDFSMMTIMYNYRRISSKSLKCEFQEFWRRQGLRDIGMEQCNQTDFTSRVYADIWKNLTCCRMGSVESSTSYKIMEEHVSYLRAHENIIIYGAGKVGMEVERSLRMLGLEHYFFAQTEIVGKGKYIGTHKVHRIDEFIPERDKSIVLIAVETKNPRDMIETLNRLGFRNYLHVGTADLDKKKEEDSWKWQKSEVGETPIVSC